VVETASTQDDLPQSPDTPHQEEKWVPLLLGELEEGDKFNLSHYFIWTGLRINYENKMNDKIKAF
jgi:hypothetical protein